MKTFKKLKKGFTLVELVVVIAVIAILAAVSVGAYFGVTESANNSRLEQEAKQVYTAIQTVSLAPNDHSSLNKTGLTITDAGKFELAIESNLGIDVALTDEQNVQDPTKPSICFVTPSVSPKLGGDTVYETFYYYNHEIGGKLAVGDILSGECKTQNPDGEIINKDILDNDKSFNLVTSVSEIGVGDKIIIAAKESNVALSTTQNNNNRGQVEIERIDDIVIINDEVQIFEIEAGSVEGSYAFNTGGGYLYAASSSNNYLKTQSEINDNSSWKIEINEGTAVITAQGTYTRNVIQYNSNSSLFACYGSASQQEVAIYRFGTYVPCEHDFGDNLKTCTKCGEENPNYVAPAAITTIPEALEAELEHPVVLDGTVTEIYDAWNDTYDNMSFYIQDAEENQILVFRCNTKVIVGDIVTVTGEIGEHGGVNQVAEGSTAEVKGHDSSYDPVDYITNIPAALTAEDGEYIQLEGEVISLDEGSGTANVTITDGTHSIYAYKMSVQDGQTLSVHDIIVITGQMSTYNSNRQISASTFVDTGRNGICEFTNPCVAVGHCTLCGAKSETQPQGHTEPNENGECDRCGKNFTAVTFEFGEKGSAGHKENDKSQETYEEVVEGNTLSLTNGLKMYPNSFDAKNNSTIKLGTSSAIGSFKLTAPSNVDYVIFNVAGYKDNDAIFTINGLEYETNYLSDDGEYKAFKIDTTVNKNLAFGTVTGAKRLMIDSIQYVVAESGNEQEPVTPTLTSLTPNKTEVSFDKLGATETITVTGNYSDNSSNTISNESIAWSSSDEAVATVTKGVITSVANGSTTIKGEYEEQEFTISVTVNKEESAAVKYTMKHNSSSTTNMTGNNDAKKFFNLDETLFDIHSIKAEVPSGSTTQHTGLNQNGDMRLYASKTNGLGNILHIEVKGGKTIEKIVITFGTTVGSFTVNGNAGNKNTLEYDIDSNICEIRNTQTGSTTQVYIKSIDIYVK